MKILLKYLEIPALVAVPGILAVCAFLKFRHTALLSLLVVLAALIIFFAHYEASRPSLRQIMPTAVMGALAAAGRILFAPFPDFKPVTAICIVSGTIFGRHAGFITGALAALVSNFFFGQGPWTPWQMYAWGMTGYFAGVLADTRLFNGSGEQQLSKATGTTKVDHNLERSARNSPEKKVRFQYFCLLAYGALAALLYGFLLNTWTIIGFIQPLTWQTALLAYSAGLPFDITHALATVLFLAAIYTPWRRKLERTRRKYALRD